MPRGNADNLKTLTPEEARELGKKGGEASGKARRERKALKEQMLLLLELPVINVKVYNKMAEFGIEIDDIDNNTRLVYSLLQKAYTGDVAALKEVRNLIGEDDTADVVKRLDELLKGMEDSANN